MTWKPHVTVAAIIPDGDRFLMVEEISGGQEVINQPAGHLEANESLVEAVIRETLEETAWQFTPQAITGIHYWTSPEDQKTFLRVCFCGQVSNHDPKLSLDEGILRSLWMTRYDISKAALRSPMVLLGIDDYLAGKRYPLELIHDLD